MQFQPPRRGIGAVEVIVVTLLVVVVGLMLLAALPRRREAVRELACRRNLAQIGLAFTLYDQTQRRLPTVPTLTEPPGSGPLATLLGGLGQPDFSGLDDPKNLPPLVPSTERTLPRRIVGFLCPSDRDGATNTPAPTNYRANSGSRVDGGNGPFAPGLAVSLAKIEAADGLAYTAAFAEGLRGDRRADSSSISHIRVVAAPVPPYPSQPRDAAPAILDAGADWSRASWRDSLYNHAAPPDSGVSYLAADDRTARILPSSGHVSGMNVLMLDLSVRTIAPGIDLAVWSYLGAFDDADRPATAAETTQ